MQKLIDFIRIKKKTIFLFGIIFSLLINLLMITVWRTETMKNSWTGPYYSAAANLKFDGDFSVCPGQVKEFMKLDVPKLEDKYKFKPCINTEHYDFNPIGFAYIIWSASHLFPFLGQQQALLLLQVLVFFILCFIVLADKLIPDLFKWMFLILFIFSPFVVRYTSFNFYYFWQIFPSFLIILYFFRKKLEWYYLLPLLFVTGLVFTFRPTIIAIVGIVLFQLFKNEKFSKAMIATVFLILPFLFAFKSSKKVFFHTAYIGIGAYHNPWDIKLSDNSGYALYEKVRGVKLNASFGGNYYEDSVIEDYALVTKNTYFSLLKANPLLFVRNVILNTLLSFSTGYITQLSIKMHYLLAVLGLLHLLILIYFRKWYIILLILASVGTVVLYYPPIPAYIFGNYLILVLSVYCIINEFRSRKKLLDKDT